MSSLSTAGPPSKVPNLVILVLVVSVCATACNRDDERKVGSAGASPTAVAARTAQPGPSPAAPSPSAATAAGGGRDDMVYVPAGEFLMGSRTDDPIVYPWEAPHEQPQHPVYVKGFYIDRTEVTNADYAPFDANHRPVEQSACDKCPVTRVTWYAARNYCATRGKRLPTEAEWEKAAKAGRERTPEPFDDYAWSAKQTIKQAQPVATKKPNDLGIYDMVGNVREWTADFYDPNYYKLKVYDNPQGPETGVRRVERGGAFFLPRRGVTETIRYNHPPHFQLYFLGFRCARDE